MLTPKAAKTKGAPAGPRHTRGCNLGRRGSHPLPPVHISFPILFQKWHFYWSRSRGIPATRFATSAKNQPCSPEPAGRRSRMLATREPRFGASSALLPALCFQEPLASNQSARFGSVRAEEPLAHCGAQSTSFGRSWGIKHRNITSAPSTK